MMVILNPAAAAAADVCHPEQMQIWVHDIVVALGMSGHLRADMAYNDLVDAHDVVEDELRRIIEVAFTHRAAP